MANLLFHPRFESSEEKCLPKGARKGAICYIRKVTILIVCRCIYIYTVYIYIYVYVYIYIYVYVYIYMGHVFSYVQLLEGNSHEYPYIIGKIPTKITIKCPIYSSSMICPCPKFITASHSSK